MTARVVAVASGKGGTGKSLLVANLGIFLASLGKRVVVIDASMGAATLHLFVGVPAPRTSIHELAHGRTLADLCGPTPMSGLSLVSALGDRADDHVVVKGIIDQTRCLDADWVLLDLGATASPETLRLFWAADDQVLAALPDPTSIEPMYRFLCDAFAWRLSQLGVGVARMGTPLDWVQLAARGHADGEARATNALLDFMPLLVMNGCRSKADMELGRAVASIARRRLGVPMQYGGHLEYDEAVWAATRRRRPLLVEHPETRIAKCVERVTRGLLSRRRQAADTLLPPDGHYDVLEIHPTASFEDIRRANRRMREVFGQESIAISGLYDPPDLEAVHRRLDVAYTTLMDASRRREYDHELFPDGVPLPTTPHLVDHDAQRGVTPRPERVMPALTSLPEEYSGAALREVREAQGMTLREISDRSKIGIGYLQAIEDEELARLPAAVYVRGFVVELARVLRLPPEPVATGYLRRIAIRRGEQVAAPT